MRSAEEIVDESIAELGYSGQVNRDKLVKIVKSYQDTLESEEFKGIIVENKDIKGADWLAYTYFFMTYVGCKPIMNKEEIYDGLREQFKKLRVIQNEKVQVHEQE